jgi:hypothetical protein
MAVGEFVLAERLGRDRDVLLLSFGVCKTKVDELDLVFLDYLENVADCHVSLLRDD